MLDLVKRYPHADLMSYHIQVVNFVKIGQRGKKKQKTKSSSSTFNTHIHKRKDIIKSLKNTEWIASRNIL